MNLRSRATNKITSILNCEASCQRLGISDFKRRVLLATLDIPAGSTISYGDLAKRIGNPGAARAIGNALNANLWLIVVPCHRVVPSNFPKSIGGYRYGSDLKRSLLIQEKAL